MSSKPRKKIIVKDTKKYGKGVFAAEDIKKGEVIHVMNGTTLTIKKLVERIIKKSENEDDPLQVGMRTYIDLDKFSRVFNHNCNPNAGLRKRSEMFALKDISKNSEITFDYSSTIAPTDWRMECKCGAENCRKIIRDIQSIPKNQLNKYLELGAIQDYMKKLLKKIEKDGIYVLPKYEINALKKIKTIK